MRAVAAAQRVTASRIRDTSWLWLGVSVWPCCTERSSARVSAISSDCCACPVCPATSEARADLRYSRDAASSPIAAIGSVGAMMERVSAGTMLLALSERGSEYADADLMAGPCAGGRVGTGRHLGQSRQRGHAKQRGGRKFI